MKKTRVDRLAVSFLVEDYPHTGESHVRGTLTVKAMRDELLRYLGSWSYSSKEHGKITKFKNIRIERIKGE